MRWLAAVIIGALVVALGGCQTPAPTAPISPPPTPAAIVRLECLPMASYTPSEQAQAAKELQAMPAGSMLGRMIVDYGALRASDRACAEAQR